MAPSERRSIRPRSRRSKTYLSSCRRRGKSVPRSSQGPSSGRAWCLESSRSSATPSANEKRRWTSVRNMPRAAISRRSVAASVRARIWAARPACRTNAGATGSRARGGLWAQRFSKVHAQRQSRRQQGTSGDVRHRDRAHSLFHRRGRERALRSSRRAATRWPRGRKSQFRPSKRCVRCRSKERRSRAHARSRDHRPVADERAGTRARAGARAREILCV